MNATTAGWGRVLASFAGFCVVVAASVTAFSLAAFGWNGWSPFVLRAGLSLVLAFSIGALCWGTLPIVAHRTWRWHSFNRWSALLLTTVAAAAAGTAVGAAAGRAAGIGESLATLYVAILRTSVPIAIVISVVITLLESSKARLAETQMALQAQQMERERAEKLAAEAQLASLASRVQPHFLFNTLNSIAALVREDPERAEQMVERLSSLLRGSLDESERIPIEHEMKLVSDYLDIQRTRLGDRLRCTMEWDPEALRGATVPPFAVQSLVENALKHVAGRRAEGVDLHVAARSAGGELVIEVTDDGPGFEAGAIAAGHGLDNLHGRLRALYGERARLEIDRAPGRMTVRLGIPSA